MNAVEADGLYQAYGRQPALRGVSLALSAGEAVALLGPNGAGKSTLLRVLSTLERPSKGRVRWQGREDTDAATRARIGLVAHESLCYADLSARENLQFFAGLYEIENAEKRVTELLERVALGAAADRAARTYSRGMLQRLALARALVHSPSLLLLDEPLTGLDRHGAQMLAALLAEEKARGAALLVVSHELPAIAPLVDRVVVLQRGRIVRDEPVPKASALQTLERVYDDAVGPVTVAAAS